MQNYLFDLDGGSSLFSSPGLDSPQQASVLPVLSPGESDVFPVVITARPQLLLGSPERSAPQFLFPRCHRHCLGSARRLDG